MCLSPCLYSQEVTTVWVPENMTSDDILISKVNRGSKGKWANCLSVKSSQDKLNSSSRLDFEPAMDSGQLGWEGCLPHWHPEVRVEHIHQGNPDYWAGGVKEGGLHWITGAPMIFTDFYQGAKKGKPFLHMNFDQNLAWDTKNYKNDRDNRYICKKSVWMKIWWHQYFISQFYL